MRFCPRCVDAYLSNDSLVCNIHQTKNYIFERDVFAEKNGRHEFGHVITKNFQFHKNDRYLQIIAYKKGLGTNVFYEHHLWNYVLENPICKEEYAQIMRLATENDYDELVNIDTYTFPFAYIRDIENLLNPLTKACR